MLEVIWQVEDGYAGPGRVQRTYIHDDELEGLSRVDRQALIEQRVREDYEEKIYWVILRTEQHKEG